MSSVLPSLDYIAGFIDGEGTIGLNKLTPSIASHTRKPFLLRPRFQASSTNRESLEEIQRVLGGTISNIRPDKPNHKPSFIWSASYKNFLESLSAVLPYLRMKHRQAELTLEAVRILRGIGMTRPHVHGKFAFRPYPRRLFEIHRELAKLNKRGV